MRYFLLLPKIRIHNANAMSSPYSIGFPAMTAWLGGVHALQRKLQALPEFAAVVLSKMAVSCHRLDLQTYRGSGDYVSSIVATGNPLDKDGDRPAFIEEARCHVEVSLLIELAYWDPEYAENLPETAKQLLQTMKLAAGDVLSLRDPEILYLDQDDYAADLHLIRQKLMLGHVLCERRRLLQDYVAAHPEQDVLDALLAHVQIQHRVARDEAGEPVYIEKDKVKWEASRLQAGWLVPIAVGFQGVSELGLAQNQRDSSTPHRFAESVLTLGEFVMPYRIRDINEILWQYHADLENNLYVCQTAVAELQ